MNDWLSYVFLFPLLIVFGAFCWLTDEKLKYDPLSLPPTPQEKENE